MSPANTDQGQRPLGMEVARWRRRLAELPDLRIDKVTAARAAIHARWDLDQDMLASIVDALADDIGLAGSDVDVQPTPCDG